MNRLQKISWIFLLLLIIGTACNKEYFDMDKLSKEIELQPALVAPLVFGRVTMEDSAIFNATSEVIRNAILNIFKQNPTGKNVSQTAFEIALNQLV